MEVVIVKSVLINLEELIFGFREDNFRVLTYYFSPFSAFHLFITVCIYMIRTIFFIET